MADSRQDLLKGFSLGLRTGAETVTNMALAIAFIVALWWSIVAIFSLPTFLLPSPAEVALAFFHRPAFFLQHAQVTAHHAALGFIIGNSLGVALAIVLYRFTRIRTLTMPVLISFQAIPIVALAPILIVWFGTGMASKVVMATILCFFPIVINTLQAFSSIDRDYAELFDFYRANYPQKLKLLLFPASFTSIVAAMQISAGLAVVGTIVAELTGSDRGLGHVLLNTSFRFEIPSMFVAMVLSALLGIVFFNMPRVLRYAIPKSWKLGLV